MTDWKTCKHPRVEPMAQGGTCHMICSDCGSTVPPWSMMELRAKFLRMRAANADLQRRLDLTMQSCADMFDETNECRKLASQVIPESWLYPAPPDMPAAPMPGPVEIVERLVTELNCTRRELARKDEYLHRMPEEFRIRHLMMERQIATLGEMSLTRCQLCTTKTIVVVMKEE